MDQIPFTVGGSAAPTDLTTANLAAMFDTPDGTKFLAGDDTSVYTYLPVEEVISW